MGVITGILKGNNELRWDRWIFVITGVISAHRCLPGRCIWLETLLPVVAAAASEERPPTRSWVQFNSQNLIQFMRISRGAEENTHTPELEIAGRSEAIQRKSPSVINQKFLLRIWPQALPDTGACWTFSWKCLNSPNLLRMISLGFEYVYASIKLQ